MHLRDKVLSRRPRPTQSSYRTAVATIIRNLQAEHGFGDKELAERLGCSRVTITNAREGDNSLGGVTLANIEFEFGPSALDPFLELGGSRAVPIVAGAQVVGPTATLPLAELLHRLIEAQAPDSDGGAEITPKELAAILPVLQGARTSIDALIEIAEGAHLRVVA